MSEVMRGKMNEEGRVVIPATIRKRLDLQPGEILFEVTDRGLLLSTQQMALQRLQQWCAANVPPKVSLADELIAERRAESAREERE